MGADIYFYIQKKDVETGKWENVTMYKGDGKEVALYRRGYDTWDYIKGEFTCDMTEDEIRDFVNGKQDWEYDNSLPWYTATYSYIKFLPVKTGYETNETPEEYFEESEFWTNLRDEVNNFLTLADEEFTHPDRIRVVALVSY